LSPIWTPDGSRIVFASDRDGVTNLYAQRADGTGAVERVTRSPNAQNPAWVSPNGTGILGSEISPQTAGDVVWFPAKGLPNVSAPEAADSRSPVEPLVNSPAIDYVPEVSPNGRYVAYQSNASGQHEIYVRPFPDIDGGLWRVSADGGMKPAWARSGRELFYIDSSLVLTVVPVQTSGATFEFENPARLFETSVDRGYWGRDYDVAVDGRLLMVKPRHTGRPTSMVVVLNFSEELKEKLPTERASRAQ
jgi:hypothetical protein